jgi:peptide/nickel transport system permease protein
VTITFFLTNSEGVNPGQAVLGTFATGEQIDAFNHELGVDRPIWQRYVDYMDRLVHGDLGRSYFPPNESVATEISRLIVSTLELVVASLVVGVVVGVALGVYAAARRGRAGDRAATVFISFGQTVPQFLLGILLTFFLFYKLGWLPPPGGQLGFLRDPPRSITHAALVDSVLTGQWHNVGNELSFLVTPVLALSFGTAAVFARVVKGTMVEALDAAHTEFGRALGLPRRTVMWFAFRTTVAPTLTFLAIVVAHAIGGAAIIETLVNWQGLGQWAVDRTQRQDIPSIQAFVLFTGLVTFLVYIVADVLIRVVDPRTRETLQ